MNSAGLARIYYAGFSIFTLGLGDLSPGSDYWRLVTAVASLMDLAMITLGITYLVPVVQAATTRRQLARMLRPLGETADEVCAVGPEQCDPVLEPLHLSLLTKSVEELTCAIAGDQHAEEFESTLRAALELDGRSEWFDRVAC